MAASTEVSRFENKIKLSLLQAEKRLVELEVAVAELKQSTENLKNIDPSAFETLKELPEIQKRLGDLEDLIAVDNLGVEEFKKTLEDIKEKVSEQSQKTSPELEAKIIEVEEKTRKVAEIDNLKEEIKSLDEVFRGLNEEVAKVKAETESKTSPSVNFDFLLTKVENLRKLVDDVNSTKAALEIRLDGLERSVSFLQTRRNFNPSDELIRAVQNYKNDFQGIMGRMEALESALNNISTNILTLESKVGKFEGFEKASALGKELEMKLDEFKQIEDEVRRVSGNVEFVYKNVDARLEKIKNIEIKFPEIYDSVKRISQETEKNRIELLARPKKEDVESIIANAESRMRLRQTSPPDISGKIELLQRKVDEEKIMLQDRVRREEILKLLDDVNRRMDELERKSAEAKQSQNIQTILKKEFEPIIAAVSTQISTLLDRLVTLETKVSMLENTQSRIQPIILE